MTECAHPVDDFMPCAICEPEQHRDVHEQAAPRAGEGVDREALILAAERVMGMFQKSGYGTPKGDRYTPTFSVDDVVLLATHVMRSFDAFD